MKHRIYQYPYLSLWPGKFGLCGLVKLNGCAPSECQLLAIFVELLKSIGLENSVELCMVGYDALDSVINLPGVHTNKINIIFMNIGSIHKKIFAELKPPSTAALNNDAARINPKCVVSLSLLNGIPVVLSIVFCISGVVSRNMRKDLNEIYIINDKYSINAQYTVASIKFLRTTPKYSMEIIAKNSAKYNPSLLTLSREIFNSSITIINNLHKEKI